ncbi:hypothetical protein BDW02DRAFT_568239 [Decorospora gaudefroyi]|uniref:Uncharacterized protein n=1 Tax=Decorospora gaudefroyi TaxID=184978 RepID=A0A6A5KBE5_9PLEO|nr:hypothetical protein BDW02DRAFT_568239 [Decorospora gaudefroyi]
MAIDVPNTTLSANDKRILNALFDPETLPSSVAHSKHTAAIDPSLPAHPTISTTQLSTLEQQQNDIIHGVSNTSSPTAINDAITRVNDTITSWPTYPSAPLNRAMLLRMKIEATLHHPTQTIFTTTASAPHHPEINPIFTDLSHAIRLAAPPASDLEPVSPYKARILRTAYAHRAYLYLKAAEAGAVWNGLGKSELEELASGDFEQAARFGDEVAREMCVRTNPYAKMCGAIVRNALREEREGDVGGG